MKALISEGKVVQIEDKTFPTTPDLIWIDVHDPVKVGWLYDGRDVTEPPAKVMTPVEVRRAAYVALGWSTPFGMLEDILDRGVAAVKADRDAI